jgi:hypothetical protein
VCELLHTPPATITARIRATAPEDERRLLSSFLGFVDSHFKDQVATITITDSAAAPCDRAWLVKVERHQPRSNHSVIALC